MTNPVKILLGNLKTILSFGSSNANKNVVTDANGDLKVEDKNNHAHGQIDKDGKVSTTTLSVGNVVVTDSNNVIKTINKLPAANVTHQDITGKLDKSQTSYKGKNVVVHSTNGEITFEDKNNHIHTVSDITDFPPIIEEIPFYWVDDFLTYANGSHNIFYNPNNDVQYLVEFIDSNDNNSGFTSDDIKTDRLYQIPYGSSYTHDICVAFTYDETNEEYNAHYVTTNERYATLYELSLKLNANLGTSNSGKYLKVDSDGSIICDVVSGGSNSVTTSTVTNSTSLPNLGGTFTTQDAINQAIDSQIGTAIAYINL